MDISFGCNLCKIDNFILEICFFFPNFDNMKISLIFYFKQHIINLTIQNCMGVLS